MVMDEFKEARAQIKTAPFKVKVDYYWYYYKVHVLTTVAVVWIFGSLIYNFVTQLPVAVNVTMINAFETEDVTDQFVSDIAEYFGLSTDEYDFDFDATTLLDHEHQDMNYVAAQQKLIGLIASRAIDAFAADTFTYLTMIGTGMYIDLNTIFSAQEMEQYKDNLFYVDQYLLENPDVAASMPDEEMAKIDPTKPETMENPIPIGLTIPQDSVYLDSYNFIHDDMIIGVVANSERMDAAKTFINYIMQN
ncbi:hypothetical protein [Candidatus Epulonipiscium viviparus]|uniref:hypothetical protein n=1 Tax=Candidatus Epulonipiscium viviparus TaxID=420336 RepID=UPI00016BFB31|nr:hypothetical protein [Candidatus Epulopiscium viviparus]